MERMRKDRIYLFWHRGEEITPISDSVAVAEIHHANRAVSGEIVFRCKPQAEEFMLDPWGYIEARYDCLPWDNPRSGELLCTITEIVPVLLTVDDLTVFVPTKDVLEFLMRVEADVSWEFIRKGLAKYEDEEG